MHKGALLTILSLSQVMVLLDFSIVNVALPSMATELGLASGTAQWIVTAYAVAFGGVLLLAGRAADLFGRRRLFAWGLAVFGVASLAGALAPDARLVIAARAAQGLGAALLSPAAFSLITTNFEEGAERNRALGIFGSVAAIGFALGVVAGGILTEWLGWRSVFYVNVPLAALALALTPRYVPAARGEPGLKLDVPGALVITLAMVLLVLAIAGAGEPTRAIGVTLALALAAVIAGLLFVSLQRRAAQPLIPLGIFAAPGTKPANTLTLLIAAAGAANALILSLYLQGVLQLGPLHTGLALLPGGIGGLVAGNLAPRLVRKWQVHRVAVLGLATLGASLIALTWMSHDGSPLLVSLAYTMSGAGIVTGFVAGTIVATQGVRPEDQGLAGGLLNTSQQVGAAIGVTAVISLITWGTAGSMDPFYLTASYRLSVGLLGLMTLVAAAGFALRRPAPATPTPVAPPA